MTYFRIAASVCFITLLSAPGAMAAPATADGAARLTGVLQRYLGTTAGVVTVTPEGESYAVVLDAGPLFALIPAEGATMTVTPQHLTLTDQGGGLWKVAQDETVGFTLNMPNAMDMTMQIGSLTWEGVYDESLSGFQHWSADMTDMTMVQTVEPTPETPGQDVTYSIATTHGEFSAVKGTTAGSDGSYTSFGTGFRETVTIADSPAMPGGMMIEVSAEEVLQDGSFKGMRSAQILDLVAFFVAHPSESAIKTDQEALRGLVQGALPLFDMLGGSFAYKNVTVTTPFGGGAADSLSVTVDMAGLVADGSLREKFTVGGLTLSDGLVPDWARDLVPTSFTFDIAGAGFNLADPAAMIVGALDLTAEPPLKDEMGAPLLAALLPDGNFDLTFAPGQVVAPLYQLDFDGAMQVAVDGTPPTGQGTIRATGMDAVIEAVNKGPADVAQNLGMALSMMRGMGKVGGVGELVWKLDATEPGTFKVNDLDLSAMGAMMDQP